MDSERQYLILVVLLIALGAFGRRPAAVIALATASAAVDGLVSKVRGDGGGS